MLRQTVSLQAKDEDDELRHVSKEISVIDGRRYDLFALHCAVH